MPNDEIKWTPLPFKPHHAVAAVRLRFLQLFPADAISWNEDQQYRLNKGRRKLLVDKLCDLLNDLDDSEIRKEQGGGIREPEISRLWRNNYGIDNKPGGGERLAALSLVLYEKTFPDGIKKPTLNFMSEMAKASGKSSKSENEYDIFLRFRARYEAAIDLIRDTSTRSIDAAAIVAHYDDWLVYLIDLVLDSPSSAKLSEDETLEKYTQLAIVSASKLRNEISITKSSASMDLYKFQRLSNELQNICISIGKGFNNRDSLISVIEDNNYFDELDRFSEITQCNRIEEFEHGLIVAFTIGDKERLERYAVNMLLSMMRILSFMGIEFNENHPVINLLEPLFEDDRPLAMATHMGDYVTQCHPAVIKRALMIHRSKLQDRNARSNP